MVVRGAMDYSRFQLKGLKNVEKYIYLLDKYISCDETLKKFQIFIKQNLLEHRHKIQQTLE